MDNASDRKILIIEDESDVADLLTLNLRKGGFKVFNGCRRCERFAESAR